MSEYVDMTEKWSRAMELLRRPAAAGAARKPYRPAPWMRAAAWLLLGLAMGLAFAGFQGRALGGQVDLLDFAKVEAGMSMAEVIQILGPPDQEVHQGYSKHNAAITDWFYFSEPDRYQKITVVVTFVGGRVVRKERFYR